MSIVQTPALAASGLPVWHRRTVFGHGGFKDRAIYTARINGHRVTITAENGRTPNRPQTWRVDGQHMTGPSHFSRAGFTRADLAKSYAIRTARGT